MNKIRDLNSKAWKTGTYLSTIIDEDIFLIILLMRAVLYSPHTKISVFHEFNNTEKEEAWHDIIQRSDKELPQHIINILNFFAKTYPFINSFIDEQIYSVDSISLRSSINVFSNFSILQDLLIICESYFIAKNQTSERIPTRQLSQFLAGLLEVNHGSLYAPYCGGGFLLTEIAQTVNSDNLKLYGYTNNAASYKRCMINIFLNNLYADLDTQYTSALEVSKNIEGKFDYIITNPPFNQKNWRSENLYSHEKWFYGIPPSSNANFAWIEHTLYALKENGTAVVMMPNSSLTNGGIEQNIRAQIIESGVIETIITMPPGIFRDTRIPFCIWVLNNSRQCEKILFINMNNKEFYSKKGLSPNGYSKILETINIFKQTGKVADENIAAAADIEAIQNKDYVLDPGFYIKHDFSIQIFSIEDAELLNEHISEIKRDIRNERLHELLEQCSSKLMENIEWKKYSITRLYKTFTGVILPKEYFGKGYPMLNVSTLINNPIIPNKLPDKVNIDTKMIEKYSIQYGDVFLNRTSENINQLARCCTALENIEAVYSGFIKRLRPVYPDILYPLYAAAYFQSAIYRREVVRTSKVFTTRASLNNKQLSKMRIYIPPMDLQKKIGDTVALLYSECQNTAEYQILLKETASLLIERLITTPILKSEEKGVIVNER